MTAAMAGNLGALPRRVTIRGQPLFLEPRVADLAGPHESMYSAPDVAANLATSVATTSPPPTTSASPAASALPITCASSTPRPTSQLARKHAFAQWERSAHVIDISDSPVRAAPTPAASAAELREVKAEPSEVPPETTIEEALESMIDNLDEDAEAARMMFEEE